jgi:hypothetical protein
MLEANGGCKLPCWWGISPGQTRWHEAKELLGLCEADARETDGNVSHDVMYVPLDPDQPSRYGIRLIFAESDGVVQSIQVRSEMFVGEVSERFPQDWNRYSLDRLLTTHGKPTQVMLEFWPNPPGPDYPYDLFVFYEHLGILINYGGSAESGSSFLICPDLDEIQHLHLWLRPTGEDTSLLQLADLDRLELAQMLPLEEATGMSVQAFYEVFGQPGAAACLETLAEVWP